MVGAILSRLRVIMTVPPGWLTGRVLAFVAGCAVVAAAGCTRTPADGSAEAGFARDMATHHAQAVEMAFVLRDTTTDAVLRPLTADIIVTQSAQRGMFMAWLQQWGLPQASPGTRMAWMGRDGGSHSTSSSSHENGAHTAIGMPGMATEAELDALRHATGREAEVLFLQLMIRHHEGGVLMAKALLSQSSRQEVVDLARSIDSSQAGEIQAMTHMLTARGALPLPSLLR